MVISALPGSEPALQGSQQGCVDEAQSQALPENLIKTSFHMSSRLSQKLKSGFLTEKHFLSKQACLEEETLRVWFITPNIGKIKRPNLRAEDSAKETLPQ